MICCMVYVCLDIVICTCGMICIFWVFQWDFPWVVWDPSARFHVSVVTSDQFWLCRFWRFSYLYVGMWELDRRRRWTDQVAHGGRAYVLCWQGWCWCLSCVLLSHVYDHVVLIWGLWDIPCMYLSSCIWGFLGWEYVCMMMGWSPMLYDPWCMLVCAL